MSIKKIVFLINNTWHNVIDQFNSPVYLWYTNSTIDSYKFNYTAKTYTYNRPVTDL